MFQAPPVEWVEERLAGMQKVLERRTDRSALLLRSLLGQIRLEPTRGHIGRPYYVARTSLDTLALLNPPPGQESAEGGSNSLRWWRRTQSIRTVGALPFEVALIETAERPVYQRVARKLPNFKSLA